MDAMQGARSSEANRTKWYGERAAHTATQQSAIIETF